MIGDRSQDMVGAANNSLAGIGVLYGYGSREELVRAGARTIVERVDELGEVLDALS
jgi:phosphoglycolate phosphatase